MSTNLLVDIHNNEHSLRTLVRFVMTSYFGASFFRRLYFDNKQLLNSGTDKNFLFSLSPKMAVYQTTGFNNHYQYLNVQQQTFPNGLVFCGNYQ